MKRVFFVKIASRVKFCGFPPDYRLTVEENRIRSVSSPAMGRNIKQAGGCG